MPVNPAPIKYSTPDEIKKCCEVLSASFKAGKTRSFAYRRQQLRQLYALMNDNQEAIIAALQSDLRKPKFEAYLYEIVFTLNEIAGAVAKCETWGKTEVANAGWIGDRTLIQYEPLGLSLLINPWNYPFFLSMTTLIPAIAAGNCCVLKPSELSPACSQLMADLFPKYLDQSCYRVINGGVAETTMLLDFPFNQITYTGSTPVGKIIMAAAAKHLAPVLLELGGKSPVYIDPSANIKATVSRISNTKFSNLGQTCVTADYVLVHKSVAKEFLVEMKAFVEKAYGPDPKKNAAYGRVISPNHHRRLMRLLEKDRKSAMFLTGGPDSADETDLYIAPTIMTGLKLGQSYSVMEDELFGPILPVFEVESEDEAVKFIGNRAPPLAAYIFAEDKAAIDKFQLNVHSGSMAINGCHVTVNAADAPFGGVGASGMGAYHHKFGFETFSHKKTIVFKKGKLDGSDAVTTPPLDYERIKKIVPWLLLKAPPSETNLAVKELVSKYGSTVIYTVLASMAYRRFGTGDVITDAKTLLSLVGSVFSSKL